jgi:glycerophosphoryl diester phosphodiesterase
MRIGHRGLAKYFPEHTAVAYQNSIAYGLADAVEIDIQESSDGVLFCIHDTTLDRTTNGTGLVSDSTSAEIDALDAGSFFAAGYAGSKPLKLLEAYSLLSGTGCKSIWPQANANTLANSTLRLQRFSRIINIARGFYLEDVTYIQEFSVDVFAGDEIRSLSKTVKIAALFEGVVSTFESNLEWAVKDGNTVLLTEYQFLIDNPDLVKEAKLKGVDVAAFTVNDASSSDKLRKIGVMMQMTDINLGVGK